MTAAALHPFQAFLERFALLVEGLGECIAGRREWDRLEQPLYASALMRLQRLFACVHRVVLSAQSGGTPPPARFPRAASRDRSRSRRLPPGEVPLPRGFGWLVRLAPGAQVYGVALHEIVSDPCLVALLANAPKARQSLRSLCVMLGTEPSAFIAPAVRKPAPSTDFGVRVSGRYAAGAQPVFGPSPHHAQCGPDAGFRTPPPAPPSPLTSRTGPPEGASPDAAPPRLNLAVMLR